ncbi:hypothetical protein DRO69_14590, partial [Candidatus Bathyarchaeota archaeon]
NWRWSPQVAFKLPAYGTVIAFLAYILRDLKFFTVKFFTWVHFKLMMLSLNVEWPKIDCKRKRRRRL